MSSTRKRDICVPLSSSSREQPTHTEFTPADLRVYEQETGLRAYRPPQPDVLEPGSLTQTAEDVHGIREAFTSGDTRLLNLARPPYAKKPSDHVLRELWDWEEQENERLDELMHDPVYRFLEALSSQSVVELDELLVDMRKGRPGFRVGRELEERQQAAQFGVTPEPGAVPLTAGLPPQSQTSRTVRFTEPVARQERRTQRRRLRESVGLPSSAEGSRQPPTKKRRKRLSVRADLNRQERVEAWDARPWLERVTVMGRFVISPRARTTINYNYTRLIGNAPQLNGVHVQHFMFSEHVRELFAQLCGTYLNFLDFMSRRTYIEVSMRQYFVGDMRNLVRIFQNSVVWDDKQQKLLLDSSASSEKARYTQCVPMTYRRTNGGVPTRMRLNLCKRRTPSTQPLFLVNL